jgi:hypothetical protein
METAASVLIGLTVTAQFALWNAATLASNSARRAAGVAEYCYHDDSAPPSNIALLGALSLVIRHQVR